MIVAPPSVLVFQRRRSERVERVREDPAARDLDVMLRGEPERFHRPAAARVIVSIAKDGVFEPPHARAERHQDRRATKEFRGAVPSKTARRGAFFIPGAVHRIRRLVQERVHGRAPIAAAGVVLAEELRGVERLGRDQTKPPVAVVHLRERARERARRRPSRAVSLAADRERSSRVVAALHTAANRGGVAAVGVDVHPQNPPQRVAKARDERRRLLRRERLPRVARGGELFVVAGEQERPVRGGERAQALEPRRRDGLRRAVVRDARPRAVRLKRAQRAPRASNERRAEGERGHQRAAFGRARSRGDGRDERGDGAHADLRG